MKTFSHLKKIGKESKNLTYGNAGCRPSSDP